MSLCLDCREKRLIAAFGDVPFQVKQLPVGDIICEYPQGTGWVAERKTANDLAKSIIDGRWADQTERLLHSGYSYVFLLVEGDLSQTNLPHETLIGACVNAELRRSH